MTDDKCDTMLSVRIPSSVLESLKALAKKARRTLSDYVRTTLEDHASEPTESK